MSQERARVAREFAEREQNMIARHTRTQQVMEEISRFKQIQAVQSAITSAESPQAARPLIESIYGADAVEEMGGYEKVFPAVKEMIRDYQAEQRAYRQPVGFLHPTNGPLQVGDIYSLLAIDPTLARAFDQAGAETPEEAAEMLAAADRDKSDNAGAANLVNLVSSKRFDVNHPYRHTRRYPAELERALN
jgi:hypothetical protein